MPSRNRIAYAFLAPYLLIFATFWVWPIVSSFVLSFQNTRINPWRFAPSMNWGGWSPIRRFITRSTIR